MARQQTVQFCGMLGTGASIREAKADAQQRLIAVMEGHWPVTVLEHKGLIAFVARQPSQGERQWGYLVRGVGQAQGQHFLDPNYSTEDNAIEPACFALAQQSGTYAGLPRHLSQARRRELDSWIRWQRAYAAARKEGARHHDARSAAAAELTQPTTGWSRLHDALSQRGMRNIVPTMPLSSFGVVRRVVVTEECPSWVAMDVAHLAEVALPNNGVPDLDAAQAWIGRAGPTTRRSTGGDVQLLAGLLERYEQRVLFLVNEYVYAFDAGNLTLDAAIEAATSRPDLDHALMLVE